MSFCTLFTLSAKLNKGPMLPIANGWLSEVLEMSNSAFRYLREMVMMSRCVLTAKI
jgi:hypothetical protein